MFLLEVEEGGTIWVSLVPGDTLQVHFEHTNEGVDAGFLQSA